jgi:elongation factor P--(R)-beta-lysine ligase
MFHVPSEQRVSWQPAANISALQARAEMLRKIRKFFLVKKVLEVETPLLSRSTVTDVHIHSITAGDKHYLQTSPEYAMKRLLANGAPSIFQICKAFRDQENGKLHNPEFSLLEWYRIDFNHHDLMAEMDELLQELVNTSKAKKVSYRDLFIQYVDLDPWNTDLDECRQYVNKFDINLQKDKNFTKDDYLELLFTHIIQRNLTGSSPWMVYDYPPGQAALARITNNIGESLALRFEVYLAGLEIANGYHEAQGKDEHLSRFAKNMYSRKKLGYPEVAIDDRFIAAIDFGLPDCAGVAVGLDRLLMFKLGVKDIHEVLAFPFVRA